MVPVTAQASLSMGNNSLVVNNVERRLARRRMSPLQTSQLEPRHPDDGMRFHVNFDWEILQLIRETRCLDRMGGLDSEPSWGVRTWMSLGSGCQPCLKGILTQLLTW